MSQRLFRRFANLAIGSIRHFHQFGSLVAFGYGFGNYKDLDTMARMLGAKEMTKMKKLRKMIGFYSFFLMKTD